MRRTCPLCALREAAVISPTCPVCAGDGYLTMGRAVTAYDAATVSTAIHLALERTARNVDTSRSSDPAPALTRVLAQLTRVGLLADPKAPAPAAAPGPRRSATPAALAHKATGHTPDATDEHMIRAAPYPYRHSDRPGARGLPIFSASGHPSSLARVGDPQPFDVETTDVVAARQRTSYHARSILLYATGAAS